MPRPPKPKAPPGPLLPGFLIQLAGSEAYAYWLDELHRRVRLKGTSPEIYSRHALAEYALARLAPDYGMPPPPPRARRGGRPRKDAG
jgi:hypothetical protein